MKKRYDKPGVYIEKLNVAAVMTYSCAQNVNSTAIPIPDGFDDETVFTDSPISACYYKVNTPDDLVSYGPDSETFCYNVPNDSTRLFAS